MANRQSMQLDGARRIHYLELGDPSGVPAIYLHGTPSSALEAGWLHYPAVSHGVRLISVDRPGYQQSDPSAHFSIQETASDVTALVRHLGLDRVGVIGFSGGAGSALAVAAGTPGIVSVVQIGGGMGPPIPGAEGVLPLGRRLMFGLVGRSPATAKPLLGLGMRRMSKTLRSKLKIPTLAALELFEGSAAGAQLEAVETYVRATPPEVLRSLVSEYADAPDELEAVIGDLSTISRPWPFDLSQLDVPVELWHGTADAAVPYWYAVALSEALPNARLHALQDEGHFVFLTHGDEVCASIRKAAEA